jgi:hypothetical protein
MNEREQVIADLKAARAELVSRGRCKNAYWDGDKVCSQGAIRLVVAQERFSNLSYTILKVPFDDSRVERARLALESHLENGWRLWEFNDADWVTDQDVLDLWDKALADLGGLA